MLLGRTRVFSPTTSCSSSPRRHSAMRSPNNSRRLATTAGPLGASEGRAIRAVKPHVIQGTGHVVQGTGGRQARADRPRLKDSGLTDRGGPLNRGTAQRPYQLCAIDPLGAHCWGFADYFSAPHCWGIASPLRLRTVRVLRIAPRLRIVQVSWIVPWLCTPGVSWAALRLRVVRGLAGHL